MPQAPNRPVLTLVAGPNGAGKSTLTASLREKDEGFLSESRGLRLLGEVKRRGYETRLVYVGAQSPEQCVRRVEQRARGGGHDVPEGDVRRRYRRSLTRLPKAAAEADRALVYDNSDLGGRARPLLEVRAGQIVFVAASKPSWLEEAFGEEQASLTVGRALRQARGRGEGPERGSRER
jgi:predicted ABC-type ATPase